VNNAIDDKELNEYLSSDTQYSQRYRAIPADDVPSRIDRLVLAQASATPNKIAARQSQSRSLGFWMRIGAPIALAASVVLVVSIVIKSGLPQVLPREQLLEKRKSSASLAVAIEEPKREDANRNVVSDAVQQRKLASQPELDKKDIKRSPIMRAVEPDTVTVAGQLRRESLQEAPIAVAAIQEERVAQAEAPASITAALTPVSKPVKLTKRQREAEPSTWLTYIRELRVSGKSREAQREWQHFMKAYPNYPVDEGESASGTTHLP